MELNETEFYSGIINKALNITNMLHEVRFIEMSEEAAGFANMQTLRIMASERVVVDGYLDN